jgi:predicted RNase H-like HicB family nuclease
MALRAAADAPASDPIQEVNQMRNFTAVIERCPDTGFFVGYVPGFPGAHSQGETIDELAANLREVIEMLLEDGDPKLEAEFVGIQNVMVS